MDRSRRLSECVVGAPPIAQTPEADLVMLTRLIVTVPTMPLAEAIDTRGLPRRDSRSLCRPTASADLPPRCDDAVLPILQVCAG
jgi:hypothetical protein